MIDQSISLADHTVLTPDMADRGMVAHLAEEGINVRACYQCGRCSSGCPVTPFFDLLPMEVVRLSSMGVDEPILKSHAIWLCASCETCTTRCPNDIDIAHLMDFHRQRALAKGVKPAEPKVAAFHKTYLNVIKRWGRIFEVELFVEYKTRTMDFFSDMGMGMKMFFGGKLHLTPKPSKDRKSIRGMFKKNQS